MTGDSRMCGINGIANFVTDTIESDEYISIVKIMNEKLYTKPPRFEGFFKSKNILLGYQCNFILGAEDKRQPFTFNHNGRNFTIVYNGEIYNQIEIENELKKNGFPSKICGQAEIVLLGYICFGIKILEKLIGVFAFCIYDESEQKIFLAHDHFGVKPLFFSLVENTLVFASEQKNILASNLVKPQIDTFGLSELFGLYPIKTPGTTLFRNIFELRPGEFVIFSQSGLKKEFYYKLTAKPHTDSERISQRKIRKMLLHSIKSQTLLDSKVCSFLSGGLDSSIITAVSANSLKKVDKTLCTCSIDFKNNYKFFKKSSFQPSQDSDFIEVMTKKFKTIHQSYFLSGNKNLCDNLTEAMIARDSPGMADIDSSLLLFCRKVSKTHKIALSGECADEIFGGYPWFLKEDMIERDFFPFLNEDNEKIFILKDEFIRKIKPKEHAQEVYRKAIEETPLLGNESARERRLKQIQYLSLTFFMQNLIERNDRMSTFAGLKVRIPFCDRRIVDYVYNIPFDMKLKGGREKGLLRRAMKGLLPEIIIERKKSPFPKTHDPEYYRIVVSELRRRLSNKNSKLLNFIDIKKLNQLMDSSPDLSKPWVGQLMARPQLFASMIQIDEWFNTYKVEIVE